MQHLACQLLQKVAPSLQQPCKLLPKPTRKMSNLLYDGDCLLPAPDEGPLEQDLLGLAAAEGDALVQQLLSKPEQMQA